MWALRVLFVALGLAAVAGVGYTAWSIFAVWATRDEDAPAGMAARAYFYALAALKLAGYFVIGVVVYGAPWLAGLGAYLLLRDELGETWAAVAWLLTAGTGLALLERLERVGKRGSRRG